QRQCERMSNSEPRDDLQRGREASRHDQQTQEKEQMIVASQNMFHTQAKKIRKRANGFVHCNTCVRGRYLRRCTIRSRAQQFFGDRLTGEILHLEILAVPIRQGRDEFGLNFQIEKGDSVEIQKNFYVVILIKTALNGAVFGDLAIRCDDNLPRYSCVEMRLASIELDLRYNPVVIL